MASYEGEIAHQGSFGIPSHRPDLWFLWGSTGNHCTPILLVSLHFCSMEGNEDVVQDEARHDDSAGSSQMDKEEGPGNKVANEENWDSFQCLICYRAREAGKNLRHWKTWTEGGKDSVSKLFCQLSVLMVCSKWKSRSDHAFVSWLCQYWEQKTCFCSSFWFNSYNESSSLRKQFVNSLPQRYSNSTPSPLLRP